MGSNFLFAIPSFLSGVARSIDIGGRFDDYNESPSEEEADALALYSDFRATGDDIRTTVRRYRSELASKEEQRGQ